MDEEMIEGEYDYATQALWNAFAEAIAEVERNINEIRSRHGKPPISQAALTSVVNDVCDGHTEKGI